MGNPDASHIGLITTVLFMGGFVGSFPASPVSDRYGRKAGILIGSFFTLAGTIIQSSACGLAQFMVGRALLGVGISFTCVACPSMVAELAHPRQRGTVLGFFNTFWYIFVHCFLYCSSIANEWQVRGSYRCSLGFFWFRTHERQLVMANSFPHSRCCSGIPHHDAALDARITSLSPCQGP